MVNDHDQEKEEKLFVFMVVSYSLKKKNIYIFSHFQEKLQFNECCATIN